MAHAHVGLKMWPSFNLITFVANSRETFEIPNLSHVLANFLAKIFWHEILG